MSDDVNRHLRAIRPYLAIILGLHIGVYTVWLIRCT